MAEIYNFWTSQGFIQTSNITQKTYGNQSGYQSTINFSVLHKYPLPDYTYNTNDISYSNSTKLLGFVRGTDAYELRFHLKNANDNYNNYRVFVFQINLYKNGVATRFDYAQDGDDQIWVDRSITKPLTHFYIAQPTSIISTHGTNTIYDYNANTISTYGSSYTTYNHMGGFSVGFCTSNLTLANTYRNGFNIQNNNTIRNLNVTIFIQNGFQSSYTNISNYELTVFYFCGGNVNYTFEDDISQQGGGFGDNDNTTDNIGTDTETELNTDDYGADLPTVLTTNLYNAYSLTSTQLQSLASVIYDNNFITALKNLVNSNPLESIISLKKYPCSVTGTNTNIIIGTYNTETQGSKISYQYKTVDCGVLYLNEKFGNFLDYNPYTKLSIYLPFIGIQTIDTDLFMNAGLQVIYNINLLDGTFICNLIRDDIGVKNIMYTFSGVCAETYSLTQSNQAQITQAMIKNTVNIGVIAGATAVGGGAGTVGALTAKGASALSTDSIKDKYNTTGSYSGNIGYMNNLKPFLIIEKPKIALPDKIQTYKGFPSYITKKLSDCTGYTVVDSINLSVSATENEKQEIEKMLKEGVII